MKWLIPTAVIMLVGVSGFLVCTSGTEAAPHGSVKLPGAKLSSQFEHGQNKVSTFVVDNRDGKAFARIEKILAEGGYRFERHTDRNQIHRLDSDTTVSVEVPTEYLGIRGGNHRYRTHQGREYDVPVASLRGRSPKREEIAVTFVKVKPRNPLAGWL